MATFVDQKAGTNEVTIHTTLGSHLAYLPHKAHYSPGDQQFDELMDYALNGMGLGDAELVGRDMPDSHPVVKALGQYYGQLWVGVLYFLQAWTKLHPEEFKSWWSPRRGATAYILRDIQKNEPTVYKGLIAASKSWANEALAAIAAGLTPEQFDAIYRGATAGQLAAQRAEIEASLAQTAARLMTERQSRVEAPPSQQEQKQETSSTSSTTRAIIIVAVLGLLAALIYQIRKRR